MYFVSVIKYILNVFDPTLMAHAFSFEWAPMTTSAGSRDCNLATLKKFKLNDNEINVKAPNT